MASIEREWTEEEYKEHFRNAMSNYVPVLDNLDKFDDAGIVHNPSEELPKGWESDHYLLFGEYLDILNQKENEHLTESDKLDEERITSELIDEKGALWVWQNRRRLAAEIIFTRNF